MASTRTNQRDLADSQARAWQLKLKQPALPQHELEAFGTWMSEHVNAQAYADCESVAVSMAELDAQGDPQWEAWRAEALDRTRNGEMKIEPLADWSNLVFARDSSIRRNAGRGRFGQALVVAACVSALVLGVQWLRPAPTQVLQYQAGDAIREVLLPDGSRLILDVGTAVDYVSTGDQRRLLLPAGRVYLDVAKDPQRSRFVVRSGEIETVVLGTRFQVNQSGIRTEVLLEEGRVRMQRPGTSLSTLLEPGQRGWWSDEEQGFVVAAAASTSALTWTRGRLLFEEALLADAIVEVNRYSRQVQIEFADERVGSLLVNGSYVAGDAELVVAAWVATLPVDAVHNGDRITLRHR